MSLKTNILANYVSQIYVTVIGIVILPLYLKYMGTEAYGLVGFFSMLQAWFNLLDMGLTPTMTRETARFRGGVLDALTFRRLVRALEGVFLVIALLGGGILIMISGQIATNWLTVKQLPLIEVQRSIQIMAIIISLRWMCGLYRGQISGSERLVWLSGYNIIIATLRFIVVLPVLISVGATPTVFFSYQLGVALIELIVLMIMSYRLLPSIPAGERVAWSWGPLKPVLKFSLTIAFTSSVWVMVTQTDKLVLSKILPLTEYGYFTLAVLAASGIGIISGPISIAIMPRMAKLYAEGDHAGVIKIYRQSTQLVAVIAGSATIVASLFAEQLLWAWTGNRVLAQQAAPVLVLYAIGNGILALSAFPYYLQYVKGNLRLHMIGNVVFVLFMIPSIIFAASHYGGVGAGYTWLVMNAVNFAVWVPFVHSKLEPGLNRLWFVKDISIVTIAMVGVGYLLLPIIPQQMNSRLAQIGLLVCFGVAVMLVGAGVSSVVWEKIICRYRVNKCDSL
ncbi:MAG: oligosaccharide flippase family protein [Desulfuromonadaceae bacterium]|nr:oligosaccharide flippase family protein [Desulfuromonadaceae bacterium]